MKNTPQKLVRFRKMVSFMKKGNVLDIGCTRPNPFLKNAIGVDYHDVPKYANYKRIIKADVNKKLPFKGNSFDNILAGEIIEHLENPLKFIKECYQILKPNGKLILSTPNVFSPIIFLRKFLFKQYNKDHLIEIPFYSLEAMFNNVGFKKIKVEGVFVMIPFIQQFIKTKSLLWSKNIICVGEK